MANNPNRLDLSGIPSDVAFAYTCVLDNQPTYGKLKVRVRIEGKENIHLIGIRNKTALCERRARYSPIDAVVRGMLKQAKPRSLSFTCATSWWPTTTPT